MKDPSNPNRGDEREFAKKLVEAELRIERLESGFRQLSSSIPNGGVIVFDKDLYNLMAEGPVLAHLGYPPEKVIGKKVSDLMLIENPETFTELQYQTLEGISTTREYEGENGSFFYSLRPIFNIEGTIDAGMLFIQEITQQKKTQKELEKRLADHERLLVGIYHDLSTPIRSVVSFAQLVEKHNGHQLDTKGINFLNHIIRAGIRLEVMVKGLLTYLQVEGEEQELQDLDVQMIITNAILDLYDQVGDKKLDILYTDLPTVKADKMEIQTLFRNLIDNAIRYNVNHPIRIAIKAERRDTGWVFSVEDNGIGIDSSHQKVIFKLFSQSNPQYKNIGGGFGLPICRKIVEKRGGKIWIKSEEEKGTVVYFTLPDKLP